MKTEKNTENGKPSAGQVVREDLRQNSSARSMYNGGDSLQSCGECTGLSKWSRFSSPGFSSGCEQDSQGWSWRQQPGCSRLGSVCVALQGKTTALPGSTAGFREHTVREYPSCAGCKESLPTFRTAQHCEVVERLNYPHGSCSENKWILPIQVFSRPNSNQTEQSLSSSYREKNHFTGKKIMQ